MDHAQQQHGMTERRACRLANQPRGTQRYRAIRREDEDALTQAIIQLASQYGRYGYRRITALLVRAGWRVGKDRVERIWRREGLKVPQKQKPRGRLWLNDGSCVRLRPERRNHVWSYDSVSARTHDGRSVRLLNLIDEYTRESLLVRAERRWSSAMVIGALADVMVMKGVPEHVRSDNVLTREGKAGEKRRFLSIPYGMCLTTTITPSGFHDQGTARAGRTLARPLQHRQAPLLARLSIAGTRGVADKQHGPWRSGNRYALPTSPHPRRRRLSELRNSCATLTLHSAQKIGHANGGYSKSKIAALH